MGATRTRAKTPGDAATPKPTSDSEEDDVAPFARSGEEQGGVAMRGEDDAALLLTLSLIHI